MSRARRQIFFARRVFLLMFWVLLPLAGRADGVPQLPDGLVAEATGERSSLDRATRILTSTADLHVTNTLGKVIGAPVHAVVRISAAGVQMPGALGAPGAAPYDAYYIDLSNQLPGGRWEPGVALQFPIIFTRPSSVRFQYSLEFHGVEAVNQPPIARAGDDVVLRLLAGETTRTVTLDGTASSDGEGPISEYLWSGTPDPADVAQPTVDLAAGQYTFALVVRDGGGLLSTTDTVQVTVLAAGERVPPGIAAEPEVITVQAGQTARIDVTGTGPADDFITLAATPRVEGATFSTQPGVPARGQFLLPTDAGDDGRYVVRFTARNLAGLTSQTTAEVIVVKQNRPPVLTVAPTAQVAEGGLLALPVQASDPDGDPVTITTGELPANAAWIEAARTFNFAPDYEQSGEYAVTFTASDGKDTAPAQTVIIQVSNVTPGSGTTDSLTLAVDPIPPYTFAQTQRVTGRVNAGGELPPPSAFGSGLITQLSPTGGEQGTTLDIELGGPASGPFAVAFVAGQSTADFGNGIVVENFEVLSPTQAHARVRIATDAATGPRGLRVVTGGETAISALAFSVLPGQAELRGRLLDPETGEPIAGARVSIQGTNLFTTTDADGNFILRGVPTGPLTLIVNAPNRELLFLEVEGLPGQSVDIGELTSPSTVFDPNAPPSASLPSVVGRGLGLSSGGMDLEDAKRLITDVMLLVGGTEAGVLDEFGNQLNPLVEGAGQISLASDGVRLIAQRMQRGGETVSLGELLYAFSHGLRWTGGDPLTLAQWLEGLQQEVNRAWSDPGRPDNAMVVAIFNQGGVLAPDPPELVPEMRLGPLQVFLFTSSLWAFIADPSIDAAALPALPADDSLGGRALAALGLLGKGLATLETKAHAQGAPPQQRSFTRYWRTFYAGTAKDAPPNFPTMAVNDAFRAQLMLTQAMSAPGLSVLDLTLRGAAAVPVAGVVHEMVVSAFKLAALANQVPEPPIIQQAQSVDDGAGGYQVNVRFRRPNSHTRDVGMVYLLWRYRVPSEPRELVASIQITREYAQTLNEEQFNRLLGTFTLTDFNPLPEVLDPFGNLVKAPSATWYYTLTATRLQGMDEVLDPDAYNRTIPWFQLPSAGRLPSYGPFVQRTKQMLVSDYSRPAVVTIGSDGIFNRVDEVEVDPRTNDVYLGIGSGDPQAASTDRPRIMKFVTTDTQSRIYAFHDFKTPGPKGLAVDRFGTLYSENASSDALFGGRMFGFAQPNGARSLAGTINYYSQMLMFANPVQGGPMDIGPGAIPSNSAEDLYVVDELAKQVKRAPVQAKYDAGRRVAQPWSNIPYQAASLDLEVEEGSGNGALLVERIASAGLVCSIRVDRTFLRPGDALSVDVVVSNPSGGAVSNVHVDTPRIDGEGQLFLTSEPTTPSQTLAGGATTVFNFKYTAGQPGIVQLATVARGSISNFSITSPEVQSLSIEIGSALIVTDFRPEAPTIAPGREFNVDVELWNRGPSTIHSIASACEWVPPFGGTQGALVGEALRLTNADPTTLTLSSGERKTFRVRFLAISIGEISFRATAEGIDAQTGDPVPAVPRTGGLVNISPIEVTLEAPRGVKLNAEFNGVVKVRNLSTAPLEGVTVDLAQVTGDGKVKILERPPAGAVTIAGNQVQAFTFKLKAIDSPEAGLRGSASLTYEGQPLTASSAISRVAIGPTIHGRLLDVVLDLPLELMSDSSPGKSLGTKVVDDQVPIAGRTIRAKGGATGTIEATSDAEGNFTLALDGPGYYYIEVLDTSTNIGYRRRVLVEDKPYPLDINLPLSLYRRARDLSLDLQLMTLKVSDPEAALNPFPPYDSVPLLSFQYKEFGARFPFYLHRFAQGFDSPLYEGLYRGVGREPNDWDALVRMSIMMAFTKRRFEEIKVPAFLVVRGLTLWVLTLPTVNKNIWGGLDNYFQGGLAARFPRLGPAANPAAVKFKRVMAIMVGFVTTQVINRTGLASDPRVRVWVDRLAVFYFKLVRFLPAFAGKALAGDFVFEAVFQVMNTFGTRYLLQDIYITALTEPILLDALNRAESLNIAGDTKRVVLEVSLMDERIMPDMYIKSAALKTLHTQVAVLRGANGLQELRAVAYKPANAKAVFKEVGAIKRLTGLILSGSSVLATMEIFGLQPGKNALVVKALFEGDVRAANGDFMDVLIALLAYPVLEVKLSAQEAP